MEPKTQTPAEETQTTPAAPATEAKTAEVTACESCGANEELFDVPHHQENNNKVWKYCQKCKDLHLKEVTVNKSLKELLNTHPEGANDPKIASMLHAGKSLDEVKKVLDTNKQPELETEVA